MNKDITAPALLIIIGFIFFYCVFTTESDSDLLDRCETDSCKYAIIAH